MDSALEDSLAGRWAASVHALVRRELGTLAREVAAYPDDATVWALPPGAPNSAGTLVQHCCGNLRHFIGATLGDTGYVRQRDAEFSERGASRAALLALLETTREDVDATFARLDPAQLTRRYPIELVHGHADTGDWLTHLVTHLAYHVGQVDYHRRLVTGDGHGVDAVNTKGVATWRPTDAAG